MYAREVGDQTLTFAVSGLLWNKSLVMIDAPTKSLWSHLLGKAMRGPLEGTILETLPSLMTDWKTWQELHPHTTLVMLSPTERAYHRDYYRHDPSAFVVGVTAVGVTGIGVTGIGVTDGDASRAWSFDQLMTTPVVNDVFLDTPILVIFEKESMTAFLFQRELQEKSLTFEQGATGLVDQQTGSTWDGRRGHAIAGPLKGQRLESITGIVSFRETWQIFHPETTYYRAESSEESE